MRHEIDGASTILRGCVGTDHSTRLEQEDVDKWSIGPHALSGDDDVIIGGIDPCGECLDDVPIDEDLTREDQFFASPA